MNTCEVCDARAALVTTSRGIVRVCQPCLEVLEPLKVNANAEPMRDSLWYIREQMKRWREQRAAKERAEQMRRDWDGDLCGAGD